MEGMGGWRREEGGGHHGPDVRLEPDIESWGRRRTQTRKRHEGRHGWGGGGWGQGGFTGSVLITHNHVGVDVHTKKARGEPSNTFILKFPG